MKHSGNRLVLALVVSGLAVMSARGADTAPQRGDPGEELKQGFVSLGHGIRDGAVKAWVAVKATFNGNGSDNSSDKKAPAKKSSTATDEN